MATRWMAWQRAAVLPVVVGAFAVQAQAASRPVTAGTPDATRAELTARLDSLQRVDAKSGTAVQQRDRGAEIASIRRRLEDGDFQAGDRFLLDFGVEQRADTVVVREGETIALLNWPSYSLRGVLRAELPIAVTRYVGTYVREPRVRVFPLTRLQMAGGIARPGFYTVDPTRPLSDAIMAAGGPAQASRFDKISIFRGSTRLLDEKAVTRALREGQTVDDLGLRSGDQVRIAEQKRRNAAPIIQTAFFSITILTALLALIRSSYVD